MMMKSLRSRSQKLMEPTAQIQVSHVVLLPGGRTYLDLRPMTVMEAGRRARSVRLAWTLWTSLEETQVLV